MSGTDEHTENARGPELTAARRPSRARVKARTANERAIAITTATRWRSCSRTELPDFLEGMEPVA